MAHTHDPIQYIADLRELPDEGYVIIVRGIDMFYQQDASTLAPLKHATVFDKPDRRITLTNGKGDKGVWITMKEAKRICVEHQITHLRELADLIEQYTLPQFS